MYKLNIEKIQIVIKLLEKKSEKTKLSIEEQELLKDLQQFVSL